MQTPFVGDHRLQTVDRLVADFDKVAAWNGPLVTFVEAPLGWGKTRIVHEVYRRLAAAQKAPYWPPAISDAPLTTTNDVSRERKRLFPARFDVAQNASPEWIWLGIACDPSVFARPEEAHQRLVAQLQPHLAPVLRRQRLTGATARAVGSLVSSLLPIPTEWEAAVELFEGSREFLDAWRHGRGTRTVGTDTIDYTAQMWKLLTSIWGADGRGGPPVVLVIEDAQFLSEDSVDLLRLVLASNLPFFVIATGWPLDGDERYVAFQSFVESAPDRLRVENLLALDRQDARSILEVLHPGTPAEVVDVLTHRFAENPYALQVFLLNRQAVPGSPWDWDDLEWLEEADSDLHTELRRLLEQSDRATLLAVTGAAAIGYRLPVVLGEEAVARWGPDVTLASALAGSWMRYDVLSRDLATFTEPVRHEAARALALARTAPSELRALYASALTTLETLLTDELPDPDTALLSTLFVDISEAHLALDPKGSKVRNEDLLATCVITLLSAFWKQRAYRAGQALLARVDEVVRWEGLSAVKKAELAVQRVRSQRLLVSPASEALDKLSRTALDFAEAVQQEKPDLYAWALLVRSRLTGNRTVPEWYDGELTQRFYEDARAVAEAMDAPPPLLIHSLDIRRYGLASSAGHRLVAHGLALDVAEQARTLFGSASDERIEALADSAFYIARVDPVASFGPTREILALLESRWGTTRHPRIATLEKDLAVRMLVSYRDDFVTEALALVERAHSLLLASYGATGRSAINSLSARSFARQRSAYVAWRRGDADVAEQYARLALADAKELARRRRALHGQARDSIIVRTRLAGARAATGDAMAIDALRQCLTDRLHDFDNDTRRAEVRWLVRDLHEALLRCGLIDESAAVVAEHPEAFVDPYPEPPRA